MPKRSSKKTRDTQELARHVLDSVVPDDEESTVEDADAEDKVHKKNPAAVALGRLGGKKGGPARAKKLTKKKRSEIARKAARARWGKRKSIDEQ